jgi:O-antigen/teichoic acid export membrane protein
MVDRDTPKLRRLLSAGLFNILLLTTLYGGYVFIYFTRQTGDIRSFWGLSGILVALVCVKLMALSNYYTTLLRSGGDMRTVSQWFLLQGAIGAILGLSLVPWLDAWGLLVGWLVANVLALAFIRWRTPRDLVVMPSPGEESFELIRIGFPIFVFFSSMVVMRTIDRIVVLRFLGAEALGYYGIAVMLLNLLLYFPDSVAYVLYPKLLTEFRAAGDDPAAIRDRVVRVVRFVSIALPLFCGLAFIAVRQGMVLLLPSYLPGVSAVRALCFGAAGLALASLGSITLMALQRQIQLVWIALSLTALGVALNVAVLRAGLGIDGVALATLTTYALYGLTLVWFAGAGLGLDVRERLGLLARSFAPLAVGMLLAYGIIEILPWFGAQDVPRRIGRVSLGWLGFAAGYLLLLYPVARGLGLRALWAELRAVGAADRPA